MGPLMPRLCPPIFQIHSQPYEVSNMPFGMSENSPPCSTVQSGNSLKKTKRALTPKLHGNMGHETNNGWSLQNLYSEFSLYLSFRQAIVCVCSCFS